MTPTEAINIAIQRADAAAAMARQGQQAIASMKSEVMIAISKAVRDSMAINVPGSRADMKYVDSIPGKRVAFDHVASIPVAADSPGPYSQSIYVTPDGYFVATHRYATFLSEFTFQVTTEGRETAQFQGRSNGRYRPVHSSCDLLDAQGGWSRPIGAASPGTGIWQVESQTNRSGFRTMQFDGLLEIIVRDSDYRRQSNPVPTSLWAPGFSGIQELPVPDVFRPGTTIEINLQANHTNNPQAGNIQGVVGSLPYLDGQFDGHEGIGYAAAVQAEVSDAVTRRPDGIFVCGFLGYRILSPASTTG